MQNDNQSGLEIYAKVEDLLGVREVAPKLYRYYYDNLENLHFNSLLDIGCGSGTFLKSLELQFPEKRFCGIDKSRVMVERAQCFGLDVSTKNLHELSEEFDIATAIFDMVNYLKQDELENLFRDLRQTLLDGGYFLFDINSEFGLSELAVGSFSAEDSNRFIAIESYYDEGIYESHFTLFEREESLYKRSYGAIKQYLYQKEFFESIDGWEIKEILPIDLYGMGAYDKELYIMQKCY